MEAETYAMGSTVRIRANRQIPGGVARLFQQLAELERTWSRFNPASELSSLRVNSWNRVSRSTFSLLSRCAWAWRRSDGAFDAGMGELMRSRGYETSIDRATAPPVRPRPGRWCHVAMRPETFEVWLPEGVAIDVGGIAKGYAADLLAAAAIERGATDVLVDVGGDIRVAGTPPRSGWKVAIELDGLGGRCATISMFGGAVATSSSLRRVWGPEHDRRHHIVDPRTGDQSSSDITSVAVLASHGWQAESTATALLVLGSGGFDHFSGLDAVALTVAGGLLGVGAFSGLA